MIRPIRQIKSVTDTDLRISTSPVLVIILCLALTMLFLVEDLRNITWRTQWEIVGIMILVHDGIKAPRVKWQGPCPDRSTEKV